MVGTSGVVSCVVEEPVIGVDGLGVDMDELGVPCACCAIVVRIN